MKVIMISGKSCHGKDTLAKLMEDELILRGEKVLITHFGDPVKWFAKQYFGWNGVKDSCGRAILQYVGTTLMRTYNKYYWGDIISEFIAASGKEKIFTYAIIPDWRFISEETAIRSYNSNTYSVRIERLNSDGSLYKNPLMTNEQLKHISETELDVYTFKYVFHNNNDLKNLEKQVIEFLDSID